MDVEAVEEENEEVVVEDLTVVEAAVACCLWSFDWRNLDYLCENGVDLLLT